MTTEEYNDIQQKEYTLHKESFGQKLAEGFLPNVAGIKKEISSLKRRIKRVVDGSCFARNLEEVEKTELVLARLKGRLKAYQEIMTDVNNKINSVCK